MFVLARVNLAYLPKQTYARWSYVHLNYTRFTIHPFVVAWWAVERKLNMINRLLIEALSHSTVGRASKHSSWRLIDSFSYFHQNFHRTGRDHAAWNSSLIAPCFCLLVPSSVNMCNAFAVLQSSFPLCAFSDKNRQHDCASCGNNRSGGEWLTTDDRAPSTVLFRRVRSEKRNLKRWRHDGGHFDAGLCSQRWGNIQVPFGC